ncbi:MAG: hypothetical protein COV52_01190 [Gammaproteobacteria bacterium CG11_big_fil_rev_8_21_14_0_20_46_22]|nr:MAG: hypothetical protein COW05_03485 [Gammaproteobacteria bacterium CG12_big_fil_rev_8_21_14_0_65_46_12]PIR11973.1 MAG: hypothetical protein COV52_01190 [Gammaproteobacteria bacterium CG11_big_fil_rev_8_21_14_0_20_46_22]
MAASPLLTFAAAVPTLKHKVASAKPSIPHKSVGSAPALGETSDRGIYLALQGGYVPAATDKWTNKSNGGQVKTSYHPGASFSAALGYRFNAHWRVELQALYIGQDVYRVKFTGFDEKMSGSARAYSGMLNGYFDLKNHTKFTPYLGAGLGYTEVRVQNKRLEEASYEGLAYIRRPSVQGMLGVNYALTKHFSLGANYTLFYTFADNGFDFVERPSGNSVEYKDADYFRRVFNVTATYHF